MDVIASRWWRTIARFFTRGALVARSRRRLNGARECNGRVPIAFHIARWRNLLKGSRETVKDQLERVRSFSQGRESSLTAMERRIMRNWLQHRRPFGIGNAPRVDCRRRYDVLTAGKPAEIILQPEPTAIASFQGSCQVFRPGNRDPMVRYDTCSNFVLVCWIVS